MWEQNHWHFTGKASFLVSILIVCVSSLPLLMLFFHFCFEVFRFWSYKKALEQVLYPFCIYNFESSFIQVYGIGLSLKMLLVLAFFFFWYLSGSSFIRNEQKLQGFVNPGRPNWGNLCLPRLYFLYWVSSTRGLVILGVQFHVRCTNLLGTGELVTLTYHIPRLVQHILQMRFLPLKSKLVVRTMRIKCLAYCWVFSQKGRRVQYESLFVWLQHYESV